MGRFVKQFIYGGAFLLIIGLVVWGMYRAFVPAPTCFDGIQNQGEEGIDCGAVCGKACPVPVQALQVLPIQFIRNADGSWDALAHLENVNSTYGAARADYALTIQSATGATLASRTGSTYVNPIQPRYLDVPLGKLSTAPASASLQVPANGVQWAELALNAAGSVQFVVRNETLAPAASAFHYEATVTNRSDFDFNQVDIVVLLDDAAGRIIAAGSTVVQTLVANETRAFTVDWPFTISGVVRAQVFVSTNVFDNTNFLRTYGAPNQFPGQ